MEIKPQQQQQQQQHQHQQHQHQHQQHQHQQQLSDELGTSRHKRNPFCSRCRNHGKSAPVKGHKRHCEYRECECEGCKLVHERQVISAKQIKLRRYQKQDEEFGRRIEVSPPILSVGAPASSAALVAATEKLMGAGGHLRPLAGASVLVPAPSKRARLDARLLQHPQHPQPQQPHQLHHEHQHRQAVSVPSSLSPLQHFPPLSHYFLGPASNSSLSPAEPSGQPSSLSDQIALVDEIHQSHGALAIYAWLRSEHFDQQKVRDLIELHRDAFHELLQLTGHSPLDLTSPIVD